MKEGEEEGEARHMLFQNAVIIDKYGAASVYTHILVQHTSIAHSWLGSTRTAEGAASQHESNFTIFFFFSVAFYGFATFWSPD